MDKLELLYDHYKETFKTIQDSICLRNKYFVILFLVMSLQFLFSVSPDSISSLIICLFKSKYEYDISGQLSIIQCFIWIILLYYTVRYYQLTVYIERQYNYIHTLESNISGIIETKFDRESTNYLENYPKMNILIDIIYKWIFPLLYSLIILIKIVIEIKSTYLTFSLVLDIIISLCCLFLTILYFIFLHPKKSENNNS